MKLLQNLAKTGMLYAEKRNLNRDVRIINYFCIIAAIACLLLILIRTLIILFIPTSHINASESKSFIVAALISLLPLLFIRLGRLQTAKILVSLVPPVLITGLFTIHGMKNGGVLLTSEFCSLYMFLLSSTAVPHLLTGSNSVGGVIALVLPMFFIVFCDIILKALGIQQADITQRGDGVEIYRMRAFIAWFLLNGCCLTIKKIIDKQDAINDALIEKLEEQNELIANKAEEKISETKNQYRLLFEQATDAIMLLNNKKRFEKVNPSACRMFGYSEEEFSKIDIKNIKFASDKKNTIEDDLHLINSSGSTTETIFVRKDGSLFPGEVNEKKLPDGNYQVFIKDITVRKNAQLSLKDAEEKFRALVEKSLAGVFIVQQKKFSYVNPQFEKIFGFGPTELKGKFISILRVGNHYHTVQDELNNPFKSKSYICRDGIGRKKNGQFINVEIMGCMTVINGKPAIIGTLIDVTEKKLLQKKVIEQKEHERKKIVRAMLNAEEKERERLGRELHDNISQVLASAILYVSMAANDDKNSKDHINNSKDIIAGAITEIRALSHRLVAPHSDLNLEELIKGLAQKIKFGSSLKLSVCCETTEIKLHEEIKLNIYRIIQEQLNNILKHAEASHAYFEIKAHSQYLNIRIKDDGKGFKMQEKRSGIGLSNIAHRVESLNGSLQMESSPGNGCTLTIQVPLKHPPVTADTTCKTVHT